MSDYARLKLIYEKSTASDYSRALQHYVTEVFTPDEHLIAHVIEAATGGTTVTLGHLASVNILVVANLDTTNFVSVTWTDTATNANTQKIGAASAAGKAKVLVIPDVDPTAANLVITADTAACLCEVSYGGT